MNNFFSGHYGMLHKVHLDNAFCLWVNLTKRRKNCVKSRFVFTFEVSVFVGSCLKGCKRVILYIIHVLVLMFVVCYGFFMHVNIENTIAHWSWNLLKFDNNSSPMGYLRVNPEKGQLSIELCTMCVCVFIMYFMWYKCLIATKS